MRPWVVSFLLVAAVTGGVLWYLEGRSEPDDPGSGGPAGPPPQVLDVQSVEDYIRITPRIDDIVVRAQADGTSAAAEVAGLLATHGYSHASWDRVRRRVEDAVVLARQLRDMPKHVEEIDREIAVKEAALEGASDSVRASLEKDLELLRRMREERPRINASDQALLQRYWTDLDRIAPHVR